MGVASLTVTSASATPDSAQLPRKRMAATMFLTDPAGRVLLVKPTYKPRWDLPGGVIEAGESPRQAAAREIEEELALQLRPGQLLVVDYVSAAASSSGTEGLITVFDGGTIKDPSAIQIPDDELQAFAFVALDQVTDHLPPLLARRAWAAEQARASATVCYLEDGHAR